VTRVLAALVLLGVVITTVWFLPSWGTLVLACAAAALAAFELAGLASARLVRRGSGTPFFPFFLAAGAACFCLAFAVVPESGTPNALGVVLMAGMVVVGALKLFSGPPTPVHPGVLPLMALAYVGLPLGALAKIQFLYGPRVLTVLFILVVCSDSAQYYTGRTFGRHKLAPAISPAKTVEGAVGGLVASALVGSLLGSRWIPGVTVAVGGVLGLTLGVVGIVGDLFESMLKRGAGVKDSSALIPGHGGVLDRIDSWLFMAPVYYVFLRHVA
jgi:phosphatidate cytidylyltransferase